MVLLVGLSIEDEVEGLATQPGVARVPIAVLVEAPVAVPVVPQSSAEVLVKKRALKWAMQQVSTLLHGKTFLRVLRPGRLLKSPTSGQRPRTVQCANSPLKPTTG